MTLPRTVADVLAEHVSFEVECIDRMYLNVYVPKLQYATGLVSFIRHQLGKPVASTAVLAPVSEAFTQIDAVLRGSGGIPWVDFAKGQRKDDVAQEYLAAFTGTEGVLFIGRAQEKVPLFRTRKRRRADGTPTRGSPRRPGWSTSTTSTASMRTSARSSSSSAATSRTTPSCTC